MNRTPSWKFRGGESGDGALLGLAVWMYAVWVTLPKVAEVMSFGGYDHRLELKTLKQSRRTMKLVPFTGRKLLYRPASTLFVPSERYVLRPMKLSSVSPYTAWRKAPAGTEPLSAGLESVPLQYFGSMHTGRFGCMPEPRKRTSGAPPSTMVNGVPVEIGRASCRERGEGGGVG